MDVQLFQVGESIEHVVAHILHAICIHQQGITTKGIMTKSITTKGITTKGKDDTTTSSVTRVKIHLSLHPSPVLLQPLLG